MKRKPVIVDFHAIAEKAADFYCHEAESHTALLPANLQKEKVAAEIEAALISSKEKLQKGLEACIRNLGNKKHFEEIKKKFAVGLNGISLKSSVSHAGQEFLKDISYKKQLGLSDTVMRHLYDSACDLLEKGDIEGAEKAFFFLVTIDHLSYSCWVGFGHSSVKAGNYEKAIDAYAIASILNSKDPWPHVWAGQVFLLRNDTAHARQAFELALPLVVDDRELTRTIQHNLSLCVHK